MFKFDGSAEELNNNLQKVADVLNDVAIDKNDTININAGDFVSSSSAEVLHENLHAVIDAIIDLNLKKSDRISFCADVFSIDNLFVNGRPAAEIKKQSGEQTEQQTENQPKKQPEPKPGKQPDKQPDTDKCCRAQEKVNGEELKSDPKQEVSQEMNASRFDSCPPFGAVDSKFIFEALDRLFVSLSKTNKFNRSEAFRLSVIADFMTVKGALVVLFS